MSADFFARQDAARRQTSVLIVYFVLAVIAIIAAVYLSAATLVAWAHDPRQPGPAPNLVNPVLFGWTTLGVLSVVLLGSLYKVAELRSGGEAVATMLGGRLIPPTTRDPGERRLLNVVEEMAIASGVPMPPVYALDREEAINAFAAGYSPQDAVVAVSRGTLQYLTRDELQGVVAHEFSHILNGDMRLNIRLIGLLHGLLLISIIGYYILRFAPNTSVRSDDDRENKGNGFPILLFGLALLLIGWIGVFFGRLIKAAMSRQREFLADASAVQFTRNPEGIAGALKKIGGLAQGSRLMSPEAEDASHLFFANGVLSIFGWLSTHPPLEQRILAIDPQWDGVFPEVARVDLDAEPASAPERERRPSLIPGLPNVLASSSLPAGVEMAAGLAGAPETPHLSYASTLSAQVPELIEESLQSPFSARALVLAVLLDSRPDIRERQELLLSQQLDDATRRLVEQLAPAVDAIGEAHWLPLVDRAVPVLALLSPNQYRVFRVLVDQLLNVDGRISLFEYALRRLLLRHLDRRFQNIPPARERFRTLAEVAEPSAVVLSTIAYAGSDSDADAASAFASAWALLGLGGGQEILPRDRANLGETDRALDVLAQASPTVKRSIVESASRAVSADGQVRVREAEMLRAIVDALDVPLPPLSPTSDPAAGPGR